jgi:ferredoxin--NADP+ reductase
VTGIRIERNQLVASGGGVSARGTGEIETIDVGLVFRSVGYYGGPIDGVPFDSKRGVFPNRDGTAALTEAWRTRG